MARSSQMRGAPAAFAEFGDFVLSHREEILRSWIAAVDRHPDISASDNLTYTQLLDHLPELCSELAALLKQPGAESVKKEAKRDAKAHGWKRWRQGYKLDELIREVCLIRRHFIDTWLPAFAATDARFDVKAQNGARRVVERFFDNVVIEATVQFVEENQQAVRQMKARLRAQKKASAAAKAELVQLISHRLREPLAPLLFAVEVLLLEESLSARGVEAIQVLHRNAKQEAQEIGELLKLIDQMQISK
jgi:signal transduction histidine kinase